MFAAASAIAEATSPVSASSFTAFVSADINCIIPCWALNPPCSSWLNPRSFNSSFSWTFAASPKLSASVRGGSSCHWPSSPGAVFQASSINSFTSASGTATSATTWAKFSTDWVISSGAPAAVRRVDVRSNLSVSFSVKTAFGAVSGVRVSDPSANPSWVSALQV